MNTQVEVSVLAAAEQGVRTRPQAPRRGPADRPHRTGSSAARPSCGNCGCSYGRP